MIKKSIAILICFNILIMSLPLFNTKKAYAAPVVGSNALKSVIVGAMEKGGIKFQNETARERAVKAWNMKAYEKWKADEAAGRNKDLWEAFETYRLNPPKPEPIPDKPGFGRILLDSTIYGMAFGIGWDIGNAIVDGYINNKPVPYYDDSLSNLPDGATVKNFHGVYVDYTEWTKYPPYRYYFEVVFPDGSKTAGIEVYLTEFDSWSYDFTNFRYSSNGSLTFDVLLHLNKNGSKKTKTNTVYNADERGLDYSKPVIYENIPVESEIPDINVPEPLKEVVNDPYAMPTSDPVEIIVPLGDNPFADNPYNNPDDWNNPNPNPEPEPEPDPESPEKVNWDKLKSIPVTFTQKFPFSLPWDIYHIVNELNVPAQKFKIDKNFKVGTVDIPIIIEIPDWIDNYTPFIRFGFVVVFIIGLIYATRSLMGGGV